LILWWYNYSFFWNLNLNFIFLAYLSSNCHVKLTCVERPATVKKEANTNAPAKVQKSLSVRCQVRKATASAMKAKKWVQVGAAKKN